MKQRKRKQYRCSVLAALTAGLVLLPGLVQAEDVKVGDVTVTATRSEMSLQDAPGAITIISQEDLADMPDGDLLEAIRETAGITLIGRSVGGRKSISIRGMDSRHSLILVDGKRIASSTAVFGHSNFENNWLTSENIERIEIVRGPLSALYGSEAIGGVINIITKPISTKDWSFGVKTGGGVTDDDGGDNAHATVYASGPLVKDRLGLYLSVGANRDDDTPSEDNPRVSELEGIETFTLNTKMAFTPNKDHTLEVAIDLVDEERWRGASRQGIGFYRSEYEIDKGMYSLSWAGTVGPTRSVVQLYRSVIEKDSMNLLSTGTTHYPEELTNDVFDAQTTFGLGSMNLITMGAELRQENLESTTLLSGEDDVFHSALFIQDEIELFDQLRI
ncbi:MAG TPA: addiction module protein, partial [Desulfocapsa sulfexigens]|nr:addiction module protein [Desulfocapsa sulfexigens]